MANHPQKMPDELMAAIDEWAEASAMSRTAAINFMCRTFLDGLELEVLRQEVQELRKKIVEVAMEARPKQSVTPRTIGDSRCY